MSIIVQLYEALRAITPLLPDGKVCCGWPAGGSSPDDPPECCADPINPREVARDALRAYESDNRLPVVDEREGFERWWRETFATPDRAMPRCADGTYEGSDPQDKWLAWQARAALAPAVVKQDLTTEPANTGDATRDQVMDQCRAIRHMTAALAEVIADREEWLRAGSPVLMHIFGRSSAATMESLGDILNGMDAALPEDAWMAPIFERAHQMFPAPADEAEPIAWCTDDGRAISAAQKDRMKNDGGACASSVEPYSIPAFAAPATVRDSRTVGVPVAWFRLVATTPPDMPAEHEADMVFGDERPDDDGRWTPLYADPVPATSAPAEFFAAAVTEAGRSLSRGELWEIFDHIMRATPLPPSGDAPKAGSDGFPTDFPGKEVSAQAYIRDWCPDHVRDYIESLKVAAPPADAPIPPCDFWFVLSKLGAAPVQAGEPSNVDIEFAADCGNELIRLWRKPPVATADARDAEDARRYRWLRDSAANESGEIPMVHVTGENGCASEISTYDGTDGLLIGEALDEAIDRAMGAKDGQP